MPGYHPHSNPGSMLDTTPNKGPLATNLQPGGSKKGGKPTMDKLSKLKGYKKKRKGLKKKAMAKLMGMKKK